MSTQSTIPEPAPGSGVHTSDPAAVPPGGRRRSPEDQWENEGGAVPPGSDPPRARPSENKQPQNTVEGCRLLAEDDLVRALHTDTDQGRRKFEHSAAAWTQRGDMLQDLAGRRLRRASAPPS